MFLGEVFRRGTPPSDPYRAGMASGVGALVVVAAAMIRADSQPHNLASIIVVVAVAVEPGCRRTALALADLAGVGLRAPHLWLSA
jgi:hypothetical protein